MVAAILIRTTATTDRQFTLDHRFTGTMVTAFITTDITDTIGADNSDRADFS